MSPEQLLRQKWSPRAKTEILNVDALYQTFADKLEAFMTACGRLKPAISRRGQNDQIEDFEGFQRSDLYSFRDPAEAIRE